MIEAGMLVRSEPMPISVTISAAKATDPPRSRTVSAMTGRIAPSPRPKRSEGAKAGRAIWRRLNADDSATATRATHGLNQLPVNVGRRDWTRTNDPHHVKVVL